MSNKYLECTMRSLANILYNTSQYPNVDKLHLALDSIKRILEEYEQSTGRDMRIKDFR